MWWSSLLPDRYDIAEMGYADYGGGAEKAHDHQGSGTPVADLVEARGEQLLIAVSPAGVFNVGATSQAARPETSLPAAPTQFVLPDPS